MSTKTELLALLAQKEGRYASGQELADTLGVSRNAIWKAVKALQAQGYTIESLPSTGYRLRQKADILTRDAICEARSRQGGLHEQLCQDALGAFPAAACRF